MRCFKLILHLKCLKLHIYFQDIDLDLIFGIKCDMMNSQSKIISYTPSPFYRDLDLAKPHKLYSLIVHWLHQN